VCSPLPAEGHHCSLSRAKKAGVVAGVAQLFLCAYDARVSPRIAAKLLEQRFTVVANVLRDINSLLAIAYLPISATTKQGREITFAVGNNIRESGRSIGWLNAVVFSPYRRIGL